MKAVIQRVTSGKVTIGGDLKASITNGFVILLGVEREDTQEKANYLAKKIANLRVFDDGEGKMNLSLIDTGGDAIVVSQFTLMANTHKGNRPSFIKAAPPEIASPLVDFFIEQLSGYGIHTQSGEFGTHMVVDIQNDGPVTILIEQ